MVSSTLAAASGVDLLTGVLLLFIGYRIASRHVDPLAARAKAAFTVWWVGMATTVLINGFREGAAAFGLLAPGSPGVSVVLALQAVWVTALCAAVWGLLYYLIYLFRGWRRGFYPLLGFYAAYAALTLWVHFSLAPSDVAVGPWYVNVTYGRTIGAGALVALVGLLLLPQIGGALAYLSLYRKVTDRTLRYRILLVSTSLLVWLGSGLIAPALKLGTFEWWQAGGRFVGLAAALVILAAYSPPKWVQRRLHVAPLGEEAKA